MNPAMEVGASFEGSIAVSIVLDHFMLQKLDLGRLTRPLEM